MEKPTGNNLKSLNQELSQVVRQIINLDTEISIYETKCNKYSKDIESLHYGLEGSRKLTMEEVMLLTEGRFTYYASKITNVFKCMDDSLFVGCDDITDGRLLDSQAEQILERLAAGFKSKDASYIDRLDILDGYGTFYDKVSVVEFLCDMKRNMYSCEGIENKIIDSCCDKDIEDFAIVVTNLYETTLAKVEAFCVDARNSKEAKALIKVWLAYFANISDKDFIEEEENLSTTRHENYVRYIDLSKRWLEYEEYLESLIDTHADMCIKKEALVKQKENLYYDLYAKSIEKKKALAWKLMHAKAKEDRFTVGLNTIAISKILSSNYMSSSRYLYVDSIYSEDDQSYLDSRDWASVK